MWYMIRNLRCTVTVDSVLANSKTQNAFLFTVNAIFLHDYPLAVEPGSTPRSLLQRKTWRDSLPIYMLLSAVSVLVVAQSSSEIPEELMNNPVYQATPYGICVGTDKCQWQTVFCQQLFFLCPYHYTTALLLYLLHLSSALHELSN